MCTCAMCENCGIEQQCELLVWPRHGGVTIITKKYSDHEIFIAKNNIQVIFTKIFEPRKFGTTLYTCTVSEFQKIFVLHSSKFMSQLK